MHLLKINEEWWYSERVLFDFCLLISYADFGISSSVIVHLNLPWKSIKAIDLIAPAFSSILFLSICALLNSAEEVDKARAAQLKQANVELANKTAVLMSDAQIDLVEPSLAEQLYRMVFKREAAKEEKVKEEKAKEEGE